MELTAFAAVAVVIFLILAWIVFKFFFRLLKHFIIAGVLAVIVAIFWYSPFEIFAPPPKPEIGKFAYGTSSKNFLGVVVADDKEGGNWIIEKSGIRSKYGKNHVTLRDSTKPLASP